MEMNDKDVEELRGRRSDDSTKADAKSLTDPVEALVDSLVDAVIGMADAVMMWQTIISCIGMAILGGVTFVLVILALSSYRIRGFVINTTYYSIATTIVSGIMLIIFFILLFFLVRKILRVRRMGRKIHQ